MLYSPVTEALWTAGITPHYCANITGHGWRKLLRHPGEFSYRIHTVPPVPPVLKFIQQQARQDDREAYSTLNMGAGFAIFVRADDAERTVDVAQGLGVGARVAGSVESRAQAAADRAAGHPLRRRRPAAALAHPTRHAPTRDTAENRCRAAGADGALAARAARRLRQPPPRSPQPPTYWQFAAADTPLGRLPALHRLEPGQSGFRPLLEPLNALQTRLALIQQARVGIDLQTYHLGNDATGRELLHALADAADRGVRVRLLIDDLHTVGLTDLLLGLAAHAGAEVRLYNPFPAGRDSLLLRLVSLAGDFSQLNRRMHNKLMVADGHVAIFGGRNLTDAYFLRGGDANFLDIELLGLGRVAADLVARLRPLLEQPLRGAGAGAGRQRRWMRRSAAPACRR